MGKTADEMNISDDPVDRIRFERQLWKEGFDRVMGLDEVGRGCLAGPVVAAGVIFEAGTFVEEIRDSKTLALDDRKRLSRHVKEQAIFWTVQWCMPAEIDKINILQASIKAMSKCAGSEEAMPDYLLVDGRHFSSGLCPHQCLIKGDDRSMSIAAASIIAKVYRDEWMQELHEEYPYYGWDTNVGYPTRRHFEGLKERGATEYHRRSFRLRTDKVIDKL